MGQNVTLGGERLGSGKKQKVALKGYERSTHDLGYNWKSTLAPGVLVPFMSQVALNGDNFQIKLNTDLLTHPTIGPLFGSYKVQLDVFCAPIRLYQAQLHNNKLGIGMKMNTIKLPRWKIVTPAAENVPKTKNLNPSSLLSYLGVTGLGSSLQPSELLQNTSYFNAIPLIAYYDIFKNYYANKQEDKAYIVHHDPNITIAGLTGIFFADIKNSTGNYALTFQTTPPDTTGFLELTDKAGYEFKIPIAEESSIAGLEDLLIYYQNTGDPTPPTLTGTTTLDKVLTFYKEDRDSTYIYRQYLIKTEWQGNFTNNEIQFVINPIIKDREPYLQEFDLSALDEIREDILEKIKDIVPFTLTDTSNSPHKYNLMVNTGTGLMSSQFPLEGLAVKTYQSDLFNNWIQTDWIDGENGISAITAVSTAGDEFTIDTLNLSMKVYYMLNRIALSGGSYDDWQETVYDHNVYRKCETPMYLGGLSKELVFQQVISNSSASGIEGEQPLGTLAGRGVLSNKHKGGYIDINVEEPSYIIGIISLTPRVCYSQSLAWDATLETMDDLHKPQLDEIGFQDLTTQQLAAFTRPILEDGEAVPITAVGKQPAWINYMTNIDLAKGNFANGMDENFMVLDRNYEYEDISLGYPKIGDLTTYIDPAKYNNTFAYTRRDAQNFWCEIQIDITARRKMSAKVMPNL